MHFKCTRLQAFLSNEIALSIKHNRPVEKNSKEQRQTTHYENIIKIKRLQVILNNKIVSKYRSKNVVREMF